MDSIIADIIVNASAIGVVEITKQIIKWGYKEFNIPKEHLNENPPQDVILNILRDYQNYADGDVVRDMFNNILHASLDKRKVNDVHRAFVDIAKQLSPLDAKILMELKNPTTLLHCSRKTNSQADSIPILDIYITNQHPEYSRDISMSIGNLERLGIIYIPTRNFGTVRMGGNASLVEQFRRTDYFKSAYIDVPSSNIDIASYKAYITEFGLSFRQIACGISPANC